MQAADTHHGNLHGGADAGELVGCHVHGVRLGGGGDERAHTQIVGTGLLGGTGLRDRLGRDADDGVRAQNAPRLGRRGVALAHMHAVRPHHARQLDLVVDDEGHACCPAEGHDGPGEFCDFGRGGVLLAQLDEAAAAGDGLAHKVW